MHALEEHFSFLNISGFDEIMISERHVRLRNQSLMPYTMLLSIYYDFNQPTFKNELIHFDIEQQWYQV